MANIRKSFSFRNGVQVDTDDLVVRSNLVGIGTTVPTETLDVRGTTKLVGFTTMIGDLQVSGVSTFANKVAIGTQVSISGGIVTANYYYGDGSSLSNLPTSQWIDIDVGLGFTSIYAAGNVGVGTVDPRRLMQIGGNPDLNQTGTVFDTKGNIYSTGVITATSFVGFGSGITEINASNISSGTLSTSRLPVIPNDRLSPDIAVSGIITATGGFKGTLTGSLIGNVTGNVTGIATTARSLTGTPDIIVGVVTATKVSSGSLISSGIVSTSTLTVGASGTAFAVLESGRIGVGTALPTSEIQIRKSSGSLLEVISNTGNARISIGQSVGVGNSTGVIRFGDVNKTLDIINNDTGNVNCYLHAGDPGIGTGRFNWIYGQTFSNLMSLTYDGKLGIGLTNPDNTLHVVGTSTVTQNAYFGGDVNIVGNLTAGTINLPSLITGANIYNTSGISTFNDLATIGNISVGSSISFGGITNPIASIDARNETGLFGFIGIGTDRIYDSEVININGSILVPTGGVGVGTTYIDPAGAAFQIYAPLIDLNGGHLNIKSDNTVGFNTVDPRAIFDFGNVGSATTRPVMVVPNISSTTRNGIGGTPTGSTILNTTNNELQVYVNNSWTNLGITTANINANTLNVSGVSTFAGITTSTGTTFFAKQINVSGVITASQYIRQGGTSSQFLKADGSIDSSTYLTTESDTLNTVTNRGNSTSNGISVGIATVTQLKVGTGITANSAGIITAVNGFSSGIGTAVQVTTVGNRVIFTVPGVGTTSLTLF